MLATPYPYGSDLELAKPSCCKNPVICPIVNFKERLGPKGEVFNWRVSECLYKRPGWGEALSLGCGQAGSESQESLWLVAWCSSFLDCGSGGGNSGSGVAAPLCPVSVVH